MVGGRRITRRHGRIQNPKLLDLFSLLEVLGKLREEMKLDSYVNRKGGGKTKFDYEKTQAALDDACSLALPTAC